MLPAGACTPTSEQSFPLAELPTDALTCVLSKLPLGQLLAASTVRSTELLRSLGARQQSMQLCSSALQLLQPASQKLAASSLVPQTQPLCFVLRTPGAWCLFCSEVPSQSIRGAWLQASKQLASASEGVFQDICHTNKWAAPRRPRGTAAVAKHFPWRSLYRHATCCVTGVMCSTLCRALQW